MGWQIDFGPDELAAGDRGVRWRWRLRDPDRGETKLLSIDVSEDALASKVVSEETARAIVSKGRSAIADVIDWPDLPDHIEVSKARIQPSGGKEPEERGRLDRIKNWFEEQNVELNVERSESGWSASLDLKKGTSPAKAPTPLRVRWSVAGKTDVEAAKRAVERYLRAAGPTVR
jgi:hypothetical protein